MKASELINKNAIRTRPTGKIGDRSYMNSPIHIIKVTDDHIVYKYTEQYIGILAGLDDKINVLSYEWLDDNWVDYDELINIEKSVSDIADSIINKSES